MIKRTAILATLVLTLASAGCAGAGRGEKWTILCLELGGPESTQNARQIAKALKRTPGLDASEVKVVSQGRQTWIYYGTYYRKVDATTRTRSPSPELERDITLLRELVDEQGQRYFLGARRMPAPSAEADYAPWALQNTDATYTLQVAVYYNDAKLHERKKAALEKCRQLRKKGYEAYYYHGQTSSMVTVGTFGPEALLDKHGRVRYVDHDGVQRPVAHRYCDEIIALQQKPECMYNLTNDNIEYNIDQDGRSVPVRSMVVRVPQREQLP
jgi:hypothetical protein